MHVEIGIGVFFALLAIGFVFRASTAKPRTGEIVSPAQKAFLRAACIFAIASAVLLLRSRFR